MSRIEHLPVCVADLCPGQIGILPEPERKPFTELLCSLIDQLKAVFRVDEERFGLGSDNLSRGFAMYSMRVFMGEELVAILLLTLGDHNCSVKGWINRGVGDEEQKRLLAEMAGVLGVDQK